MYLSAYPPFTIHDWRGRELSRHTDIAAARMDLEDFVRADGHLYTLRNGIGDSWACSRLPDGRPHWHEPMIYTS